MRKRKFITHYLLELDKLLSRNQRKTIFQHIQSSPQKEDKSKKTLNDTAIKPRCITEPWSGAARTQNIFWKGEQ